MTTRTINTAIMVLVLGVSAQNAHAWKSLDELTPPAARMLKANEQARFEHAMGAMLEEDLVTARKLLQPLAANGVTPAQVALASGLKHAAQPELQQDALKWFYFAARSGDERAQYEIGLALYEGKWLPKDNLAARNWLKQATINQNEDAAMLLADIDRALIQNAQRAIAVKNYSEAEALLTPLAKDDQPVATQILGKLYVQGMLTTAKPSSRQSDPNIADLKKQQYEQAISLLQKEKLDRNEAAQLVEYLQNAAEPGKADAQYRLGMMYFTGQMVDKNDEEGLYWYRLAADQGHTEAQFSLGVRYVLGQGTDQDPYEAHRWFKRAAEHGYAKAQHNLALTYMHGIGTDRQIDKAQEWFKKASHAGIQKASGFVGQPNATKFIAVKAIGADPSPVTTPTITEKPHVMAHVVEQKPTAEKSMALKIPSSVDATKQMPANPAKVKAVYGWDWFKKLPAKGYTLQVISAVQARSVDDFVAEHRLNKNQMFRYIERMKNKNWNIVQVGYFETEEQAQAYAKTISSNFRAFKPMVRDMKWLSKQLKQKMTQES